jgi:hypothetical protein
MSALQVELLYFVVDIFMTSIAKVNFVEVIFDFTHINVLNVCLIQDD